MHPALLDLATGVSLCLMPGYESSNDFFLPVSYKRMSLFYSLPAKLFSHIRFARGSNDGGVRTFDLTIFDDGGKVLAEIEGFSMRRIADPAVTLRPDISGNKSASSDEAFPAEFFDRTGIQPAAGARALMRILSVESSRAVIAVSHALDEPGNQGSSDVAGAAASVVSAHTHEGQTIETVIAAWWREMLGVDRVEVDDDFFDLGGHSLVGARLLAKIKRVYGVDMDLAVLFESSTLRELANVVRQLQTAGPTERMNNL
jgi:acyl carrier protein